ncbi:hypothetical protein COCNU_scaffold003235G000010 [Cocos nucifera]|nr:hypothetical protein [Cocos nucifera]
MHLSKVECLWKELREELEKMMKLRTTLALEEVERRKAQKEVGAAMEMAIQDFKSSKDMEDIKIAFAQEALLEEFQVCLGWITENFPDIDLDLLIDELGDKVGPSCADVEVAPIAYIAEVTSEVS